MPMLSASVLYNAVKCPQRVAMDAFADPGAKEPESEFVQMLWEQGTAYEARVLAAMEPPPLMLGDQTPAEREQATLDAIAARVPLIAGGRLRYREMVGEPDLLRLDDGAYIPVDIKAGGATDGGDDDTPGKPKLHYAVQLAFYVHLLEQLGVPTRRAGAILDIDGQDVPYALMEPRGPRTPGTLWDAFEETLARVQGILSKADATSPALSSICKQCAWRSACRRTLDATDDLTLIPELGRAKRDEMAIEVPTVAALARADLTPFVRGKSTVFRGVGPGTLVQMQARARLITSRGAPYALQPLTLPAPGLALFFDVETDPLRDVCYLHGIVVQDGDDHEFRAPFAASADADGEAAAFGEAMAIFREYPGVPIYYYSQYERTTYRALVRRHPHVATAEEVDALFARGVDLYAIVRKHTIWPTNDHSIKTLAKHLGFSWRDQNPSGAASIQWYMEWESTRSQSVRQRILDYNEDDCLAMRVVLDGLRALPVGAP
jgi:predicted RecB family nuclease